MWSIDIFYAHLQAHRISMQHFTLKYSNFVFISSGKIDVWLRDD